MTATAGQPVSRRLAQSMHRVDTGSGIRWIRVCRHGYHTKSAGWQGTARGLAVYRARIRGWERFVMVTLNVNPENISRLILLASEFHAQETVAPPEEPVNPTDEGPRQMLSHRAGDLTLAEFRSIIEDLEPDQQAEVVAVMWIGRGDFEEEEWDQSVQQAEEQWTPWTADYLIAHPLLPYYLSEGLDSLGYSDS